MFILESGKITSSKIKLKFNLDGKNFEFEGSYRDILRSVANFCFDRDYQFENIHDEKYVSDKIKEKSFSMSSFHKLPNGKFLSGFDHANKYSIVRISTKWLSSVGKLESISLDDESIEPIISFNKFKDDQKIKKMTFVEAAQLILKNNNNRPMTSLEIWKESESKKLVETLGKTPWDTMNAQMILYSDNTNAIGKKKNSIFRIIEDRPYKFILINPNDEVQSVPDEDIDGDKYYLLGAYDGTIGAGQKSELWKTYVDGGYWLNGFAVAGVDKLKEEVNNIPVGANVAIKSSYVRGKVNPVIMIKARGVVTKNYGDGTKIDVDWEKGFKPFEIQRSDVGGYRQTLHDISNKQEHIDLIFNSESVPTIEEPEGKIQRFGQFGIPTDFKAAQAQEEKETKVLEPAERNPFGGESKEAGDEFNSSALFVVGTSGAGKSTRILSLLRKNGHKLILIGAENAPSPNLLLDYDQNEGYVPSDIAEFIISAKNDPTHFYTIVFDECHEYIDEIKRSILHAISTKRGEKRFFGVRKSVRDFFEDLETYETTSKIVPDNVGFIFISSKPDVFEYHADFMGRVDKVEVKREDPYPYPDLKYIQSKIDRQDQL